MLNVFRQIMLNDALVFIYRYGHAKQISYFRCTDIYIHIYIIYIYKHHTCLAHLIYLQTDDIYTAETEVKVNKTAIDE